MTHMGSSTRGSPQGDRRYRPLQRPLATETNSCLKEVAIRADRGVIVYCKSGSGAGASEHCAHRIARLKGPSSSGQTHVAGFR
jgi:hypothetical protein